MWLWIVFVLALLPLVVTGYGHAGYPDWRAQWMIVVLVGGIALDIVRDMR